MKLVAFSDLHCDLAAARAIVGAAGDADVVIGAGDFATMGTGAAGVFAVLRGLTCPFIYVHGNHDDPFALAELAWDGAHFLHGNSVAIAGVTFYGVGGETPLSNDADWNIGQSEDAMTGLLAGCPKGAVLVSHAPPLGVCDLQRGGGHEGSAAILACVEDRQSTHVLCGHIHNAWGMRGQVGPSQVANLGPAPVVFTL